MPKLVPFLRPNTASSQLKYRLSRQASGVYGVVEKAPPVTTGIQNRHAMVMTITATNMTSPMATRENGSSGGIARRTF